MGYVGKLAEKNLAIDLRKKGLSYSEIGKYITVSKDSLSRWCRDIVLTPNQLERLSKQKLKGSVRGRIKGAKTLQKRRLSEIVALNKVGRSEVGALTRRDRFIAGVALYIGEGGKSDKSFFFTNSDPRLIKFMTGWIREFCDIRQNKLIGKIWIHDNLDEFQARIYWSKLTGIPLGRFYKSYIVKDKTKSRKIRKQIHPYGVFSVGVNKASLQRRVLGWMAGVLEAK